MTADAGVSFVVPVRNGERWIASVLEAILQQTSGARPIEVIVIDDGSEDGSRRVVRRFLADSRIQLLTTPGRGAAAALNAGFRKARFPLVAQVDQDVVLQPGWLEALAEMMRDQTVGAAQGVFAPDRSVSFFARVMGLDLAQRHGAIKVDTDHVCTGNALYRASAVNAVGRFDDGLGYGYDNDMSYRLTAAGFRLVICRAAVSHHRWREGLRGYLVQQYGFGYGRLDLVVRHRQRWAGDAVSPPAMMAHPIVLSVAAGAGVIGVLVRLAGGDPRPFTMTASIGLAGLLVERAIAGMRAWKTFGDPAGLWFPVVHLLRDAAWAWAGVCWTARRFLGRPPSPAHSMMPRERDDPAAGHHGPSPTRPRT